MGHKFLKHIERTKILFHLVSALSEDPIHDYTVVKEELRKFNPELEHKKEFVFISRADEVSEDSINVILKKFKEMHIEASSISVLDEKSLVDVKKILSSLERSA